ncbi:acrosin-like [Pyrgilauda ruficollis]|uniref:acrosin-like n=1 Tax=Pyrgilauda ruficollis TaxID=221976 RepID=UPI001B85F986|nr:acrosin-like [Pyrgilauda ruficollis]
MPFWAGSFGTGAPGSARGRLGASRAAPAPSPPFHGSVTVPPRNRGRSVTSSPGGTLGERRAPAGRGLCRGLAVPSMAPLWLLVLLAAAAPARATWDSCDGTCGLQPMAEEFGGSSGAVRGAWPGLASVQDPLRAGSGHVCGGSLIAPGWLLTAARCLPRARNVSSWRVVLGAADLSDPGPEAQVRRVLRARRHPGLDVALLQLQPPAECSDFVQLGCVSEAGPPRGPQRCYIAGWARLEDTAPPREVLREAQVRLLRPELCDGSGAAPSPQVCAKHSRGGSGTCQGDPGGPLVCRSRGSGPFWLIGVSSGGRGCVFTPAWLFSRWILQQLGTPGTPETPETPGTAASPDSAGGTGGTGQEPAGPSSVLLRFFSVLRELLRFLRDSAG